MAPGNLAANDAGQLTAIIKSWRADRGRVAN